MEGSASPTCWKTVSPEEASAPKAAMKPSMANLPLTVSGALPAKAMASPKVGAFGAGGWGGGVALRGRDLWLLSGADGDEPPC